jgi:hypothetical protein
MRTLTIIAVILANWLSVRFAGNTDDITADATTSTAQSHSKLTCLISSNEPSVDPYVLASIRTGFLLPDTWLRTWGNHSPKIADATFYEVASAFDELLCAQVGFSGEHGVLMAGLLINTTGQRKLVSSLGVDVSLGLAVGPMITKCLDDGLWSWGIAVIPLSIRF